LNAAIPFGLGPSPRRFCAAQRDGDRENAPKKRGAWDVPRRHALLPLNNKDRETVVAGHVHVGAVGVNGDIVVELFVPPAPATSARHIKQGGVVTPETGTTGAALCENPSAYYVNYHTTVFEGGAIRGQLR
jgi:CHRD domain